MECECLAALQKSLGLEPMSVLEPIIGQHWNTLRPGGVRAARLHVLKRKKLKIDVGKTEHRYSVIRIDK